MAEVIDTSVLIGFLRGHSPAVEFVKNALRRRTFATVITVFELEAGVLPGSPQAHAVRQLLEQFVILPLDEVAARRAGEVERSLRARGEVIGVADTLIAGIALSHQLAVATENVEHFERVPNLEVIPVR